MRLVPLINKNGPINYTTIPVQFHSITYHCKYWSLRVVGQVARSVQWYKLEGLVEKELDANGNERRRSERKRAFLLDAKRRDDPEKAGLAPEPAFLVSAFRRRTPAIAGAMFGAAVQALPPAARVERKSTFSSLTQ